MKRKKKQVEGIQRAKKIKMYPTLEQKKILISWFRVANNCYNKVIELLETETDVVMNMPERH